MNNNGEFREGRAFSFSSRGRGWINVDCNLNGIVNASSKVFVSICQVQISGGQVKPAMGTTMTISNVVPQDNGIVTVRLHIDSSSDLDFQLSVLVFP
jgi:hypothetical protein